MGVVDGVTTNPCLLASQPGDPWGVVSDIVEAVDGPVSIQVTEFDDVGKMVSQGSSFASLGDNVVVKVPCTPNGFRAAEQLLDRGIQVNATAVFHPVQAIPFLRLGVEYVSLVVGKAEDAGDSHEQHIGDLLSLIDAIGGKTQLISCSIRNPRHLITAATAGSHVITVPPHCWDLTFKSPDLVACLLETSEAWHSLPEDCRREFS